MVVVSLLAMVLFQPMPLHDGPLEIRMRFRAETHGVVRLRDVAELQRDPRGVWPWVADLIVVSQGEPGVTRGRVLHRLRGEGLSEKEVRLRGPAVCRILRKGRE